MEGKAKRALARAGLALGGAWMLGACMLGGEETPTIAGHFGDRLDGLGYEQQLDSSLKAFEMMKAKTGGTYRYRSGGWSWIGASSETWIHVQAGVVVRRTWKGEYRDSLGKVRPASGWTETGPELGSHENMGHPPILLDSLYTICREALRVDTAAHHMFFALDENYLLGTCGSIPKGVQDGGPQVSVGVRWD